MLTTNDYLKITDLADELIISTSTATKDLQGLQKSFAKNQLTLKQKHNCGMKIMGKELFCREVLTDTIFQEFRYSGNFSTLLPNVKAIDLIEKIILQVLAKYEIELTDTSLTDFILYIITSISRIQLGFYLEDVTFQHDVIHYIEFDAANELASMLEQELAIVLSEQEVLRIGIELIGKKVSLEFLVDKAVLITKKSLQFIHEKTLINFECKPHFYEQLLTYISSAIFRQQYKAKLRNPIYVEIREKYIFGFELSQIVSSVFQTYNYAPLSNSELSYFTLLFHASLSIAPQKKKDVLLICGLSDSAAEYISWQIHERFGNQLQIIKKTQYYKLQYEPLDHYDLIISIDAIPDEITTPSIHISPLMEAEDFNRIHNFLIHSFPANNIESSFHFNLFKNINTRHKKDIVAVLQTLLDKECKTNTISVTKILKDKQGVIYENDNHFCMLKYDKPLSSLKNTIVVIINAQPVKLFNQQNQIFVFISYQEKASVIESNIYNMLISMAEDETKLSAFWENPTYYNFIDILKQIQV